VIVLDFVLVLVTELVVGPVLDFDYVVALAVPAPSVYAQQAASGVRRTGS
jgi:hypothetical protein